ncbi:hypothetical protein [Terrarubrum flagellatum]|uniref:hypothetical protein n=1 Tax=Terrirubrum flagellatum TaxID=2895980 RepID=UPI003144F7DC
MFLSPDEIRNLPERLRKPVALQRINQEIFGGLVAIKARWLDALPFAVKLAIVEQVLGSNEGFALLLNGVQNLADYSGPLPAEEVQARDLITRLVNQSRLGALRVDPACAAILDAGPHHRNHISIYGPGLMSPDPLIRLQSIKALRGDDQYYTDLQGAIPASFIALNRHAIRSLVQEIGPAEAIFSLERGGALVADHIVNLLGRGILNYKISKVSEASELSLINPPQYARNEHIGRFQQAIRNFLQFRNNRPVTIVVTESVVGGASAGALIKDLDDLLRDFPQLHIKILLQRQSINRNQPLRPLGPVETSVVRAFPNSSDQTLTLYEGRSESIPLYLRNIRAPFVHHGARDRRRPYDPAEQRAEVVMANSGYLLGEDVNYQVSYSDENSHQPVTIFSLRRGVVRAVRLAPMGPMTARDILQRIIEGAYDAVLESYGIKIKIGKKASKFA